jgi:hypothetical protein
VLLRCDPRAIVAALGLALEDLARKPDAEDSSDDKDQMIKLEHLLDYFKDVLVASRVLLQQADVGVIERWRGAQEDLARVAPINVTDTLKPYAQRIETALHILPIEMFTPSDTAHLIQLIDEMLAAIEEERRRLPPSERVG